MTYDDNDIGFLRTLTGASHAILLPTQAIDFLQKAEIFHHLFAAKLIAQSLIGEDFNCDISGLGEKLDAIIEQLREANKNKN